MNVNVTLEGADRLLDALVDADRRAPGEARRLVDDAGERVAEAARDLAPVQTGALRDSIGTNRTGSNQHTAVINVAPTVDYAAEIEFGTASGRPQPYMGPAADAEEERIVDDAARVAIDLIGRW